MTFPIEAVRARFPALAVTDAGVRRAYLDAPGGTQVCAPAIARMVGHLEGGTANGGGAFVTSRETDALARAAREAVADLIGGDGDEIGFGPNMTTLTLSLSRALARTWRPGDEIVLTRLDHDANVAPWLAAAADAGAVVRWLDIDPGAATLRLDTLPGLIGERTRLVAVGGASNALGTVNDIAAIAEIVRARSSALLFVDAVQSVPHLAVDVAALGCDFLAFSLYKMFGPHQGVLWGRAEVLRGIEAYKVRPASIEPPGLRFETGTPSFEGMAAALGTVEYLEWLGGTIDPAAITRRARIEAAMHASGEHEHRLGTRLLDGLAGMARVRLWGAPTMAGRVPTFAFTVDGTTPDAVEAALAARGVFLWSGHFYALEPVGRLGLLDAGGLVRVGLCHYNDDADVDQFLAALDEVCAG
jgi:cysteine desulfurase family protein (TIGR01976 family)